MFRAERTRVQACAPGHDLPMSGWGEMALRRERLGAQRRLEHLRRLMRDIAKGRELGDVTTRRDPSVVGLLGQTTQAADGGSQ